MTCEHINRVREKLNELIKKMNEMDYSLVEELGPYIREGDVQYCVDCLKNADTSDDIGVLNSLLEFYGRYKRVSTITLKRVKINALYDYHLVGIREELRNCNCRSDLVDDYNNLSSNSTSKYNELVEEYNKLLGKKKEVVEDYNKLVGEYNELLKSSSKKYINLQSEYNVLHDEKERLEEKYSSLDCEHKVLKEKARSTDNNLEELRGLFDGLKIVISNKDYELEKRERKVKELKELLGKSREEIIDYKIKNKEEKLENIIKKAEVDRAKIRELRKVCQQLVRIQGDGNQDEIDDINDKIEDIKDELIDKGFDMIDAEKICRKCKSIAKLKAEQEKLYQERFEASQEVVLYDRK